MPILALSKNRTIGYGVYIGEESTDLEKSEQNQTTSQGVTSSIANMNYHIFAFEFKPPFSVLATFKLPQGRVPIEIMPSNTRDNIIIVGCENSMIVLLLDDSKQGKELQLVEVRDVEVSVGVLQDFCLVDNFIFAKNDNNDIVEMFFPNPL